jgi:hypothetical protein
MISDTITALIKRADALNEEIEDLEQIVSQRKADLSRVLDEDIPTVLHDNGLTSVALSDGRTVSIEQMLTVVQVDKPALCKWLELNDMGEIVKTNMDFGKGVDISELEDFLGRSGIGYQKATEVHPQTLKKAMREFIEGGGIAPDESIAKVSIYERAKIKEARN